jgi:integrase
MRELENSSNTVLNRLQELHDAAKVMDPCRDWSWIRRIASQVRAKARPARNKAAKIVSSMDLLDLGFALMKRAASEPTLRLAALMFRDGLLIALIALRPLRRKNLASMTLGQHLAKRGGTWWLSFAGDEMKNHDPLEVPWPDELSTQLETWLSKWRPVLCQRRGRWAKTIGGALWVSAHGSPLTQDGLYGRFVIHTKEAFGHTMNPHLARDIAATTLADVDPEHVRVAAPLLGHRNFATTERYYLHGQRLRATRRWQQTLLHLRRRRRRKP